MQIRALLLVEDDAEELARARSKLAQTEINVGEVLVATSLAQAIWTIVNNQVDVILLDLDLGDSRSLDTLNAVRSVTDEVVIVLSCCEDEVLSVQSLAAGADEFLVKSKMTVGCLQRAIVKSMTRRKIRRVRSNIDANMTKLAELVGAT